MKKYLPLLCCVVLALFLCACNKDTGNEVKNDLEGESTAPTNSVENNSEISKPPTDSVKNEAAESLCEKLVSEIEGAYLEAQKAPENSSTGVMADLALKYSKKWQQLADEYYDKIMKYDGITQLNENYYSSDDLHTFVSNMKTNWEEYNQEQCANYEKTLQTIYGGGTIVGPIFADYKYEMQKEWALQLVGIYQQLGVE